MKPTKQLRKLSISPGDRRGRLLIQHVVGSQHFLRGVNVIYECLCDCGAVVRRGKNSLLSSREASCGCIRRSQCTSPVGSTKNPLYKIWLGMHERCTSQKHKSFRDYGARGINVCARWTAGDGDLTGFECFLADMGERPAGLTIERSNNDGPYSPSNCSWASRTIQSRNRRSVRIVEVLGRRQPVSAWAEEVGLPYFTLVQRLNRGWPPARAVMTPVLKEWDRHPNKSSA